MNFLKVLFIFWIMYEFFVIAKFLSGGYKNKEDIKLDILIPFYYFIRMGINKYKELK